MNKKQLGILSGTITALMLMGAGCNSTTSVNTTGQVNDDQAEVTTSAEQTNNQGKEKENDDKKEENEADEDYGKVNATATVSTTINVKVPPVSTTVKATIKEFTITAKDWEWSPKNITVKKGDTVRLHITSADVTHSFMLKDFSLNVTLEPGVKQTVEFVADKVGTFSFRCGVPCGEGHREMTGTITVE